MRGAIHDVTADKERQQRLTRSEHLLRYAPEQLLVINEEMTVTYQSPPSPQCEWAQREFTDNNPLEHMHPDDRSRVAAQLNTVMRQPSTVSTVEFRVQDADDDWRWVESRLQNVADTDVIDGILAAMRDVSARKCQEQQLTQYTSFFEQLQATIQTLLQSTDAASAAAHAIESFESILEFDVAGIWLSTDDQRALEPVATSARGSDLVPDPPTYTPDTSSLSWTAYQNQELEYVSNVHERDDRAAEDTPIRSEVIVPLGRHGLVNIGSTEPDAFSAVEIDLLSVWCDTLTLVFARIAQLQVLQKRETALADERDRLEEFTATVSHDLRNPLNVAMGRAELASDECESSHLETVIRALDRMNDLIDDSLSLARQGTVVRDMGVVDLEQMVTECWQNANVDTATFVVEETAAIYADADRVPQVFENLFHNAVVHGGETVTVRVGCTTDGFYIADDGTGVTSEVKDRLFETGYTTRDEGRGYGLAIVERICEAHGWNIRVSESNAGGARFDVTGVEFP
jgi:PAS domain S-box-containing protein